MPGKSNSRWKPGTEERSPSLFDPITLPQTGQMAPKTRLGPFSSDGLRAALPAFCRASAPGPQRNGRFCGRGGSRSTGGSASALRSSNRRSTDFQSPAFHSGATSSCPARRRDRNRSHAPPALEQWVGPSTIHHSGTHRIEFDITDYAPNAGSLRSAGRSDSATCDRWRGARCSSIARIARGHGEAFAPSRARSQERRPGAHDSSSDNRRIRRP